MITRITRHQLVNIARLVEAQGLDERTVTRLRMIYPGMHFTYCLDDDVTAVEPVQEGSNFNIYLVDARAHCLRLTEDPQVATGLVLAEIINESV
jgi:hypothetical protein